MSFFIHFDMHTYLLLLGETGFTNSYRLIWGTGLYRTKREGQNNILLFVNLLIQNPFCAADSGYLNIEQE